MAIVHPNRLITAYLHLRNGSIVVAVGETVTQGQKIGEIGSSGDSPAPHLHFQVQDTDLNVINPWAGPCGNTVSLWADQDPYEDFFVPIDDYLLAEIPSSISALKQGPESFTELPAEADDVCLAVQVLSIQEGDASEFRFVGPGSVSPVEITHSQYRRWSYWWGCRSASAFRENPGGWEAQYWHNGSLITSKQFDVIP